MERSSGETLNPNQIFLGSTAIVSTLPSENRIFCTLVLPPGFGCGYKLMHPSWIFDDAGVNRIGVAIIRETVTLAKGGDSSTGDVTIDVLRPVGQPAAADRRHNPGAADHDR